MSTFVLYMFISIGFGSVATGGPVIIDGFTSQHNCEAARADFSQELGSKLDTSFCKEVVK